MGAGVKAGLEAGSEENYFRVGGGGCFLWGRIS